MIKKEINIEELKNLSFHDQSIEAFYVNFSLKEIKIILSVYNENYKNYDNIEIIFVEVSNLFMNNFHIELFKEFEVYSHEVSLDKENKIHISFILLLGFGKPNGEIQFSFSSCFLNT